MLPSPPETISTCDHPALREWLNAQLTNLPTASQEEALLHWLDALAERNVVAGNGGPFAALLLRRSPTGATVIGVGANHVIPYSDPSAHAEMEAFRDAASHLGHTHWADATLLTSCECCPMCLSGALNAQLAEIVFAATRDDAAAVGFSDAAQYALLAEPLEAQCSHATGPEAELLGAMLGEGTDAVVLVPDPTDPENPLPLRFAADALDGPPTDGTASACIRAIRRACQTLGVFHLPPEAQLISRYRPHPMSLIAADWARIGRQRDADQPDNPAADAAHKDPRAIRYVLAQDEPIPTRDAQGQCHPSHAQQVLEAVRAENSQRTTPTRQCNIGPSRAFAAWGELVAQAARPRY